MVAEVGFFIALPSRIVESYRLRLLGALERPLAHELTDDGSDFSPLEIFCMFHLKKSRKAIDFWRKMVYNVGVN